MVPQSRALRDQIRAEAVLAMQGFDRSRPLSREGLQKLGEELLARLGLEEKYLGFTLVMLSNEFWRDQLMAVDFSRRLLLLPHCLKHAEGCPADYDEFGLDCRKCGACDIADYKATAEDLGYKVLVAEGTPIVLKIIVSGHVDAVVGVACLNVLEKALDKVLVVGIPSLAVPLLSSDCKNTSVDEDWVAEVIGLRQEPPAQQTRTYVHLMRAANQLFEPQEIERLSPRVRLSTAGSNGNGKPASQSDTLTATEQIAYDWLIQGGKRFRPFITLAGYDALRGGTGTLPSAADGIDLSDAVRRTALSIETFHKASLVHDDIEDDDCYRYGRETLHRRHGMPVALNVGDYLVGLGYRLVSREAGNLDAACVADLLDHLADAHVRLAEGQGAELSWRQSAIRDLKPLDALKIYALKTAPAFEVALYAGLRLAGAVDAYAEAVSAFSRHLGVAFQILNDLDDWERDDNKLLEGQDVLAARPTLLLALALEASDEAQRAALLDLSGRTKRTSDDLAQVRAIYRQAAVFDKAEKMVEKYRERAEAVADDVEPAPLRELLYFLVDTVLERRPPETPEVILPTLPQVSNP